MELIFLAFIFGLVTLLDKPDEPKPKPKPKESTVTLTIKDGKIDKIDVAEKK
jgi:hypothetical protein